MERPSFIERQKDAALEQVRNQQAEARKIEELILGRNHHGRYVSVVVKIGDDWVAEVVKGDEKTWTFVVNGKASMFHHGTQEEAILHLIASRYEPNLNENYRAAYYAGRVLGLPNT